MEFRLLGPLQVLDEGRELHVGKGKQRALLALLLLHANERLSLERIVDQLWETPPASATKIVQNAVSDLRKALGDGCLSTWDRGYSLVAGPGELDLERFEELAGRGRRDGDRELLAEALALWRGPPLDEFVSEPFTTAERARLDDLRIATVEARIDGDLAAGESSSLVPELERLRAEHPLRERLHGQLMLALYRAGRKAEALEAYRHARRVLVGELGLEPGRPLQELERAILEQDPDLDASPPPAATPPPRRARSRRAALVAALAVALAALAAAILHTVGSSSAVAVAANSVVAIDPRAGKIVGDTQVGLRPQGVVSDGKAVWVAISGDRTVARLDAQTGRLTATIGVGGRATAVALGRRGLWVATGNDGTLVELDPAANALVQTIPVNRGDVLWGAFAVAAHGDTVWTDADQEIVEIDQRSAEIVRRYGGGLFNPEGIVAAFGEIWSVDVGDVLYRITPGGHDVRQIQLGASPYAIAAGAGSLWVAAHSQPHGEVIQIDPTYDLIVGATPVGSNPEAIAFASGAVWVVSYRDQTVSRIDPKTAELTHTIRLGRPPRGIAGDGKRIWVTVD